MSDAVHNFIDRLVIAASFITNFPLGVATTLAVALHEIPQELGDFALLVYGGFKTRKALFFNFISALTAILGVIVGYLISSIMQTSAIYLLPFAAGNFIYIAAADLIPEIKQQVSLSRSIVHFIVFMIGIAITLATKYNFRRKTCRFVSLL